MSDKKPPAKGRSVRPPTEAAQPPWRQRKPQRNAQAFARGALLDGRYRILSTLGAGGMGVVYEAVEVATGHEVAIKALSAEAFSEENLRRFRREAQTAAAAKSQYLCEVHSLGVIEATPFIVMERLRGETLSERIADTGPLGASEAVAVMMQVLEGLSALHGAGVLHRDVKPANVFITSPRGAATIVKIIDFGLAKRLGPGAPGTGTAGDEESTSITTTNMIAGTPEYLAPEQFGAAGDLDPRVDVWAAGMTLYEMLVGRRAFEAPSYAVLAMRILREPFAPASSVRPGLPVGLDRVLEVALAKERDERFPTAAAFRAALIAEWARHRTEGVARGERLRESAVEEPVPASSVDEVGADEFTELDVHVQFEPDD